MKTLKVIMRLYNDFRFSTPTEEDAVEDIFSVDDSVCDVVVDVGLESITIGTFVELYLVKSVKFASFFLPINSLLNLLRLGKLLLS